MPTLAPARSNARALGHLAAKRAMPTELGTSELRKLGREVLERAHFSAKTSNEALLRRQMKVIRDLVDPQNQAAGEEHFADPAAARLALKQMLRQIGYNPGTTGPIGTLQDLASDPRLDLILKTNVQTAQGAAEAAAGLARSDEWPALELIRMEAREIPRPWSSRWLRAGEASGRAYGDGWGLFAGRMLALKGHPIWQKLGDPDLFDDGLGNPYPPFAFSSGMWTEEVSLADAIETGLIPAALAPNRAPPESAARNVWEDTKHPRNPAGAPDGTGGQFAPVEISGTELGEGLDDKQMLSAALKHSEKHFRKIKVTHIGSGAEIEMTHRGVKKGLRTKPNREKSLATPFLPKLLAQSKAGKTEPDRKLRKEIENVLHYEATAIIAGQKRTIRMVARKTNMGLKFYGHKVMK